MPMSDAHDAGACGSFPSAHYTLLTLIALENELDHLPGEVLKVLQVAGGDTVDYRPVDRFIVMHGKITEAH